MADALNQRRSEALQLIDEFIDTFNAPLHAYIQAENHIPNLQVAINRLDLMIIELKNPAITAGGVAVEVLDEEDMNEVRNVAVESVNQIRNLVPLIQDYINGENNFDNLDSTIARLNTMIQDLIAALMP